MKTSVLFSIVLTFGYLGYASAITLAEPITSAFMKALNEDQIPTESMCAENFQQLEKLKTQASILRQSLEPMITSKLPNPNSSQGLEDVVNEHCVPNTDIKSAAESAVSLLKKCLNGKTDIDDNKSAEIEKLIINNICYGLRATVSWRISVNQQTGYERLG